MTCIDNAITTLYGVADALNEHSFELIAIAASAEQKDNLAEVERLTAERDHLKKIVKDFVEYQKAYEAATGDLYSGKYFYTTFFMKIITEAREAVKGL